MKKMVYGFVAVLGLLSAGCTGSFQLMQAIHRWHTGFQSQWTDEICYLIPGLILYGAAWIGDTIMFNSMEFWLGESPIMLRADNTTVTRINENTAIVRNAETGATYTVTRNADGTLLVADAQGNSVLAERTGSLVTMTASDGSVRTTLLK